MDEISEILKTYPADCWPTAIEPLGSAGGLSGARFWRVVAPRGALVLRCWPIEHPTPDGLQFIHAVFRHSASRGMTILPVPVAGKNGMTFLRHGGHLWELAPWLPGIADYEKSPRMEKLRAAMSTLARFHVSVVDFPAMPPAISRGIPPAVTQRLSRLIELQDGGIELLTRSIDDAIWPDLEPLARESAAMAPRVVPLAIARLTPFADVPLSLQVCIRDVWHDHILFTGDVVTGLIDFGAMQVDTPATDVARLLGSLVGDDPSGWQTGLAAYSEVRPLSDSESMLVPAIDASGTILALFNWLRWIYVDGRDFEDRNQVISRVQRLLSRLRQIENIVVTGRSATSEFECESL